MAMNALAKVADDRAGKKEVADTKTRPDRSLTETMRAVTWQGKRHMEVRTVAKPVLTDPHDVILRITACTICSGSDGHIYAGEIPTMDAGLIIGHECMGIVESKGDQVSKYNVGQRVVVAFDIACGSCEHCKMEQFTGCEETNDSRLADNIYGHAPAGLFGYSRLLGNYDGSQAEFVRVPFADTNCFPVPDDVPDDKALFLSDVLCTALHACELGEVKENDVVAIWGLGPIGLCAARWAQIKGAKRIIGIDLVPERLALAREKLGIEVIDRTGMTSQQLINTVQQMEPKGLNCAIEAAGFRFPVSTLHTVIRTVGLESDTPELIDECLTCIRPYGFVSVIADYAGYSHMFPVGKIMFKHATVRSGQCPCQKYFEYVMETVRKGEFDPTFMITHRLSSLDEIPLAYEKLDKKEDGYIKVFVTPSPAAAALTKG
jgi:threonine dehydrogenase-like Zn-dependent dehydrogenase